jgi:sucrose phosphorylase
VRGLRPPSLDGACDHPLDNGLLSEEEEDHDRDHCHEYGREHEVPLLPVGPGEARDGQGEGEQDIVPECNDDAYLAARAIRFFAPGIPQVYYVGLLAGRNDVRSVQETGKGRAINRHNYSVEEVDRAIRTEVVQRLLRLIRFRNTHPGFNGGFKVEE